MIPTFGEIIKGRREELGMLQKEVARRAGVTESYVCYLENGKREGCVDKLRAVARALDCDLVLGIKVIRP